LLARWTEENAFSQLKPDSIELWGDRVHKWLPDESCYLIHSKNPDVFSRVYITGLKAQEGSSPFSKVHGKKFACALIDQAGGISTICIRDCPCPDFLSSWFPNGSLVYVRGLKPSEGASLFSKFAGLNLALIYLDQPEEIPHSVFQALKARLSQPGYPHEMYLSPNPPEEDHWLAEEFPLADSFAEDVVCKPNYRYIRTTVYDNRENLDPEYVPQLEADYPEGHVLRRRFIEGRRGLSVEGTPVYKGYFQPHQACPARGRRHLVEHLEVLCAYTAAL
jgi:hypothetical protein